MVAKCACQGGAAPGGSILHGTLQIVIAPLLAVAAWAAPPQVVRLEVASAWRLSAVEVETVWLGEARTLALTDDGRVDGDLPGDGVWVGEWTGEAVRLLPVRVYVTGAEGARVEVSGSVEPLAFPHDRLVWVLEQNGDTLTARRAAAALPSRPLEVAETAFAAAGFGWAGLLLLYVGWLVRRLPPR